MEYEELYFLEAQAPPYWYNTARFLWKAALFVRERITNDIPEEGVWENNVRLFTSEDVGENQYLHALVSKDIRELFNQSAGTKRSNAYGPCPDEVEKVLRNIPKMARQRYRAGHPCYAVYLFLAGLAVENILKCICVVRHPELTGNPPISV